MRAVFNKQAAAHRITLNRREAEALAYTFAAYAILLKALELFPDSDEFTIYGSKAQVSVDLAAALA